MNYLKAAKENYYKQYPGEELEPLGASEEEIQALESRIGLKLAPAHREFLLWMGRDHHGILSESNWYLEDFDINQEGLLRMLEESGQPPPDGPYVCFLDHNGYVGAWYVMTPTTEADPTIMLFTQGDKKHPEPYPWGKFSAFIDICISESVLNTDRYLRSKGLKSTQA